MHPRIYHHNDPAHTRCAVALYRVEPENLGEVWHVGIEHLATTSNLAEVKSVRSEMRSERRELVLRLAMKFMPSGTPQKLSSPNPKGKSPCCHGCSVSSILCSSQFFSRSSCNDRRSSHLSCLHASSPQFCQDAVPVTPEAGITACPSPPAPLLLFHHHVVL